MRPNSGKRWVGVLLSSVAVTILSKGSGYALLPPTGGQVSIPGSSVEKPGDTGVRAHTNIEIFIPKQTAPGPSPNHAPPAPGTTGKEDTARPQ